MSAETAITEAAHTLVDILESEATELPFLQRYRDEKLGASSRKIVLVCRKRFTAQKKAVMRKLHFVLFDLRKAHPIVEAERDTEAEHEAIVQQVSDSLAVYIYAVPVTAKDVATFDSAMAAAVKAGASGVAQTLDVATGNTESFISRYLKENGFSKLSGELDKTSVDRLSRAVADAYESGGDFSDVTKAIRKEFADFSQTRAAMIAQTELNDAFNASMLQFGEEAGGNVKYWEVDTNPCLICIGNELASPIPIADDFPSGHGSPTAHPRCECSLRIGRAS